MAYQQLPPQVPVTIEQAKKASEMGRNTAMGCGGIILFVASCFFLPALFSGNWIGAIPSLVFVAVGGGITAWGFAPTIRAWKITEPEISLSHDAVRLGEPFDFRFHQKIKDRIEVDFAKVEFLMRETAIYRRGTDTYTETHEIPVDLKDLAGGVYTASDYLDLSHRFTVPENAMHTFVASNNRIEWLLRVTVSIKQWPDVKETYPVCVLPERFEASPSSPARWEDR